MSRRRAALVVVAALAGTGASAGAGYAVGHQHGEQAGQARALAGLDPQALALVHQLGRTDALAGSAGNQSATPSATSSRKVGQQGRTDCEKANLMRRTAQCADFVPHPNGLSAAAPASAPAGPTFVADPIDEPALHAAQRFVTALRRATGAGDPALVSHLQEAARELPAGARLGEVHPATGRDADRLVEVSVLADVACVHLAPVRVANGSCYADGAAVADDKGGDYGPKRFAPQYVKQEGG